jgi:phage FluMu protein gp41
MENLFKLTLADGLQVDKAGAKVCYRTVYLRETSVGDERAAQRLAERVVPVNGTPRLVVSDAEFRHAMTMRHIEAFECDGQRIGQGLVDMEMLDKLSSHDLGLIEQRVFLIEMAAEVRYGNMSQADLDALLSGAKAQPQQAPQPVGQAAGVGRTGPEPEPGPALLADFTGSAAHGSPAGDGA